MNTKHTPGPWTVGIVGRNGYLSQNLPQRAPLAVVEFDETEPLDSDTQDEPMANARLIALAPEMLAFVGAVAGSVKCSESTTGQAAAGAVDGWIDHARALLARLEGDR